MMDIKTESEKPACFTVMRMVPPKNHLEIDKYYQGICSTCGWTSDSYPDFQDTRVEMDRHLKKIKK